MNVPWLKSMKLVDANVILRYLLNDHAEMSQQARTVIDGGAYTKPEIIAEVVYVLKGVYHASRTDIRIFILEMLNSVLCSERDAVAYAVNVYADTSLDFVDCLLIAYHVLGKEDVFTFDKALAKRLGGALK